MQHILAQCLAYSKHLIKQQRLLALMILSLIWIIFPPVSWVCYVPTIFLFVHLCLPGTSNLASPRNQLHLNCTFSVFPFLSSVCSLTSTGACIILMLILLHTTCLSILLESTASLVPRPSKFVKEREIWVLFLRHPENATVLLIQTMLIKSVIMKATLFNSGYWYWYYIQQNQPGHLDWFSNRESPL